MKRTILIAEDEERMRRILEVNLQDQYRVLLAKDGEEALRFFRENEVHLLVTDLKIPGRDGLSSVSYTHLTLPTILLV